MKKGMGFLLAVFCLLSACTAQTTGSSSAPAQSVASAESQPESAVQSEQHEFKIGSDQQKIQKAQEVAADYYKNVIGSERLGWNVKKYTYDPVYGSEFESIWLQMLDAKKSVSPNWTFYAFDVAVNENQNHMIVVGESPDGKWEVVNYGH
jgi:hypothetical protein